MKKNFQNFINIKELPNNKNNKNEEDLQNRIRELEQQIEILRNERKEIFSVIIKTRNDEHIESFVCKSSDNFNILENQFYELHPEYKDGHNLFWIGKNVIDKEKTLKDNNIGRNAKIIIEGNE